MHDWDREFARDLLERPEILGRTEYILRGRQYKRLSSADLNMRWVEALRTWTETQTSKNSRNLEYLTGELNARGKPLPLNSVEAEMGHLSNVVSGNASDDEDEDDLGEWLDEDEDCPDDEPDQGDDE